MLSFTAGANLFQTLSQISTTGNSTLYGQLANIEHRYLLQKYFNNETSYSVPTVGGNTYYITAAPVIGAVSATLAYAWSLPTNTITVTFSDGEARPVLFTNGSTAITWQVPLAGTSFTLTANVSAGGTTATLSTAWQTTTQTSLVAFTDGETRTITFTQNSTAISWVSGLSSTVGTQIQTSVMTTAISIGGAQFYRMPPNYSKLKDITITVGVLQWTLTEVRTREEWDNLNVFPYFASIPSKFFIYPGGDHGGKIGIWPIPSNTANIITFNYKFRVPDLSISDYTTPGTIAVANGSSTVTGTSTTWQVTTNAGNESRWLQIAPNATAANSGDNLWYQIASVDSATSLTLYQPYQGTSVTASPAGTGYTIGQMPLIAEDFQDMLVWKSLTYYFSSIVDNPKKAEEFQAIYDRKLQLLSEYSGSNTVNVNLSPKRAFRGNPNSFPYNGIGRNP